MVPQMRNFSKLALSKLSEMHLVDWKFPAYSVRGLWWHAALEVVGHFQLILLGGLGRNFSKIGALKVPGNESCTLSMLEILNL